MSRDYRFLLLDSAMCAVGEMALVCLDDPGALLIAERLAQQNAVEVWDGHRLVGLTACVRPTSEAAAATSPADSGPAAEPGPESAGDGGAVRATRPFKPFWSGAWRRGAPSS